MLGMISLVSILPSARNGLSPAQEPPPIQKATANVVLNVQHDTGTWSNDYSCKFLLPTYLALMADYVEQIVSMMVFSVVGLYTI